MTAISRIVALAMTPVRSDNPLVIHRPLPALPPDLAEQVRSLAGSTRFTDRAGNAMTVNVEAGYHPEAGRYAAEYRQALASPATPELIDEWVTSLAAGLPHSPQTEKEHAVAMRFILGACRQLPSLCFTDETFDAAARRFKRWPGSAAELYDFLLPFSDEVTRVAVALDRVARADPSTRFHTGPAREAKGYVPPPPPPPKPPRVTIHPTKAEIIGPVRTVEEQLAAFGFTRETVPPIVPRTVPPPRKPGEAS
jgi:hypothetical protein